ncbi:MAG: HD domain-containing protein [Lachnospiraceae bacterium]|nr:HD domain-containing protein [Lachnospiraceae bacterium]
MYLDFTDTLYALSFALDAVEKEYNGVLQGHGKRVAWMSECLGRKAGIGGVELIDLTGVAVLHDNSIIEFLDEIEWGHIYKNLDSLGGHCKRGEERIRLLPFKTDLTDAILYHHENANGEGPFGKTVKETPLSAQIIHMADSIDTCFDLTAITKNDYKKISEFVHKEEGEMFGSDMVSLFDEAFSYEEIERFCEKGVDRCLKEDVPTVFADFSREEINGITGFFSEIIDFKSSFTKVHSIGVAKRAEMMAAFYGWDKDKTDRFYFAGALHDIGKMVVKNDILEKPDKLTDFEFVEMKNHAAATYRILHQIEGMEDITEWAANHHEKLDGMGYPRGLRAEELPFEDRVMAIVDIYQALTENRPYKAGLSHEKTISMMRDMAGFGKIDGKRVEDANTVFG